jgi:coproporphyrinogen III oxidase-like Fe-S oxidoreductase
MPRQVGRVRPKRPTWTRLRADLEATLPLVWGRRVVSVFIGGGTPSLFDAGEHRPAAGDVRALLPLEPLG